MGARGAGGWRSVPSGSGRRSGPKGRFRQAAGLAGEGRRGVRSRSVLTDWPFMLPTL
jgi:hypothetical protein